jgi:hypothetical protein
MLQSQHLFLARHHKHLRTHARRIPSPSCLFLQAHRDTEDCFAFMGAPAQPDQNQFRFRRAAFYSSLKIKVGLIAAKAAALRINMNTDSCLIASRAASRRLASSHATSLLNSSVTSLSHTSPALNPSLTLISVGGGRSASCGLFCYIAPLAFYLIPFGPRKV